MTTHTERFLGETSKIAMEIDHGAIERIVNGLVNLRNRFGRLFILGVGGSAANSGHAVNDFRKLAGIEAYAPTDNVSELTARTNDEGFDTIFSELFRMLSIVHWMTANVSSRSSQTCSSFSCKYKGRAR